MHNDASPKCYRKFAYGTCFNFYFTRYFNTFLQKLGKNVLWQPGTDHAGIATEIIVEKQLIKEKNSSKKKLVGKILRKNMGMEKNLW